MWKIPGEKWDVSEIQSDACYFQGQDQWPGLPTAAGKVQAAAHRGERVGLGGLRGACRHQRGLLCSSVFIRKIRDNHL